MVSECRMLLRLATIGCCESSSSESESVNEWPSTLPGVAAWCPASVDVAATAAKLFKFNAGTVAAMANEMGIRKAAAAAAAAATGNSLFLLSSFFILAVLSLTDTNDRY